MTLDPATERAEQPMIRAFPEGGALIRLAYRELNIAATGTKEEVKAIGDARLLPRPWDPPTCLNTELREQVWAWLEDVVTWLNSEYVWTSARSFPVVGPNTPTSSTRSPSWPNNADEPALPSLATRSKSGTGTPCWHSSNGCAPGSRTTARKATNGGPPAAATHGTPANQPAANARTSTVVM